MTAAPAPWLRRSDGPGELLTLTLDKGGERWTLDGRPLHAGEALEVLLRGDGRACPACGGEGRLPGPACPPDGECPDCPAVSPACDDVAPAECPDCDGHGDLYRPAWLHVRFEFHNAGDGTGYALLFPALWHGAHADRLALRVLREDRVRARWPWRVTP